MYAFFVRKKWYLWINLIQYVRWGSFRPLILQLFRIAGNFKFICWHLVSLRVKIEWVAGLPCSTKKLKGQMATVMWKHCKNDLPSTLDIPFQKKNKMKNSYSRKYKRLLHTCKSVLVFLNVERTYISDLKKINTLKFRPILKNFESSENSYVNVCIN